MSPSAYSILQTERNRKLRDKAKDVPCADCGGRFPSVCMDFDHVRGEKLFQIGAANSRSTENVLAEIAKCDVICANCHRIRTHGKK